MKTDKGGPKILSDNSFPVVGIGASAGGLEAFKKLIKAIPENSGMAYVLVQHLDPNHESILPSLLQKVTTIPVLEISDEIEVLPNHIYIIPSNKMLVANDGVLQLSPRPPKGNKNLPIDLFFTSLAEVHQTHAIGVVLSGTASDGTAGLKAIKDHGGVTFAQDEASAAYDGMPQSAARAGVVDFILPPEEIPGKLWAIKQLNDSNHESGEDVLQAKKDFYQQILLLLRIRKGTDFTYYKHPTIQRRILRRMVINKIQSPDSYLNYLRENEKEQDLLYQDLLIPVTAFFRDHKLFDRLCESVFPHIAMLKTAAEPMRIWVAGCSTGQEAYSVAICLLEFIGDTGQKAQVFATDISEPAIAKARAGIYTNNEIAGVATNRLQEFFTKTEKGYQINKQVRDMCVFATHDFLKDPPFGKIDFVSCRNVLIYLEPYLQVKALTTFHYALNPKGYLLLGKSETGSNVPMLFSVSNKIDKLFTRRDAPAKYMHVASLRSEQIMNRQSAHAKNDPLQTDYQKTVDSLINTRYTPACVVVNDAMEIVHFRGDTSIYLQQATGKPTHNLLKMARSGLGFELRNVIGKARKEQTTIIKDHIPVGTDQSRYIITIEAVPLPDMVEPHYLIVFYETPTARSSNLKVSGAVPDEKDMRILQLGEELAQNREDMRNVTADQESANEDLQGINEDLLSTSEELQSLNEELETSKEELQSTNEELTVLNQELNGLNELLKVTNEEQIVLRKKLEVQATTMQDLLMTAPGCICTLSGPDHVYEMVNERYQDLFGKRKIQGRPMFEALPELAGQGFEKILDKVYTAGEPYSGVEILMKLARDEGLLPEDRYFNFSYQPMYDADGKIHAILVIGNEVTDHVIARDKISGLERAHARELEACVQQRTQELSIANEALLQKNEVLISTNKDLESFTYVSSHDLQEPLRKIQIFSARILSEEYGSLSGEAQDSFQRINNAASRMQRLIQDLLAYAHTNISERKFETTNLNMVVAEVLAELSENIFEKAAVIDVGNLCDVRINRFQFRQVMQNMLVNALKFSRAGIPPHINITSTIAKGLQFKNDNADGQLKMLSTDKTYCRLTIADNGIGFDPQYKDKIFEVFQRLHSKDDYAGTGIGLSIVKKIIAQHSGVIIAAGEVNKGAVFHIYIPAA